MSPRLIGPMRYASVLIKTSSPGCTRGSIEGPVTCGIRRKNAIPMASKTTTCTLTRRA